MHIKPYNMHKEMLVLEETSIDEMGAFLVYAPIDLRAVTSIVNGGDATKVFIFPLGIILSLDGHLSFEQMEVVASVHYLLRNIILNIKATLGCSDFLLFNVMLFVLKILKLRQLMVSKYDAFPSL